MTNIAAEGPLGSGKGHRDENFPVASRLIRPRHRRLILAFYRFARTADDIADHPTAAPQEKIARLSDLEASLIGLDEAQGVAVELRRALLERGLSTRHPLDLLEAFRRDVTKLRYGDWEELMDYCRYSAAPVGRFVLDVHGEDEALWPANDALCSALQIVNHLQDCAKDYRSLDRVYLPLDVLRDEGIDPTVLEAAQAPPPLRRAIATLARRTQTLLETAAPLAQGCRDRRLGLEVAVIARLAASLNRGLMRRDPLSQKVHHGKAQALALALRAGLGFWLSRRRPA